MELCIGIGFIILCLAHFILIVSLFSYKIKLSKKELDAAPDNSASSQTPRE